MNLDFITFAPMCPKGNKLTNHKPLFSGSRLKIVNGYCFYHYHLNHH